MKKILFENFLGERPHFMPKIKIKSNPRILLVTKFVVLGSPSGINNAKFKSCAA
jgi:hypothetical protein